MNGDCKTLHYSNRNWSELFTCPVCGTAKRQNTNFLGQRRMVCSGDRVEKIHRDLLKEAA